MRASMAEQDCRKQGDTPQILQHDALWKMDRPYLPRMPRPERTGVWQRLRTKAGQEENPV